MGIPIHLEESDSTVKIFSYLVLKDKILTRDGLSRRGMRIGDLSCVLCTYCERETTIHLLFFCQYASQIWHKVSSTLGIKIMIRGITVEQIWTSSWRAVNSSRSMSRNAWTASFMCTVWHIWKQRNRVIFGDTALRTEVVAQRCVQDFKLWLKHC